MHHPPLTAPPPVNFLRSPVGLGTATSVLMALVAVTDLVALYAGMNMHQVTGRLSTASSAETDRADLLYALAGGLQAVIMLATGVVFLIWFHRVRRNADVFAPHLMTRGSGWAIGSWFIPLANLWIPFTIAREIWAASTPAAPDGTERYVSRQPLVWWWGTWIAALLAGRIGATLQKDAETAQALQRAVDATLLADTLDLAAACLALYVVRTLTTRQHHKATQGPRI